MTPQKPNVQRCINPKFNLNPYDIYNNKYIFIQMK